MAEKLDEPGYQSRPASLMTRADAGSVVAVKVLIKRYAITPVRIDLELIHSAENGPASASVPNEYASEPV